MSNLLYNLAQPFSDTKQYTQGTIVVYNDRMYEMTASDYTPGAFNSEKFTERFLSEMISGKLNSNLITPITINALHVLSASGISSIDAITIDKLRYSKMTIVSKGDTNGTYGSIKIYVDGTLIKTISSLGTNVIDLSNYKNKKMIVNVSCTSALSSGAIGGDITLE